MDDLGALLALCLGLLGHGTLHCHGQLNILDLHGCHLDAPAFRMLVNDGLQFPVDLVALGEQFIQFGLAQHIAQRRLTDLRSRLHEVHHVYNGSLGVHYIEVDDRRTLMVTLSREITSCGGTVRVTIRRSTLIMRVTKGGTQNRPGPFAPVKRPRMKITPRSYCCTTRKPESAIRARIMTITPIRIVTMGSIEMPP